MKLQVFLAHSCRNNLILVLLNADNVRIVRTVEATNNNQPEITKMSTYVCSTAHFKALATFAVRKQHGSMLVDPRYVDGAKNVAGQDIEVIATRYAAILLAENVRSVRERYADDVGDYDEIRISTSEVLRPKALSPVVILKLCNCLAYQSCETDDWETTNAYKLLQQIKDAAIRLLPGYEEAPWGLHDLENA